MTTYLEGKLGHLDQTVKRSVRLGLISFKL